MEKQAGPQKAAGAGEREECSSGPLSFFCSLSAKWAHFFPMFPEH